uniref:MCAfunc domain-containing protein n=1 Tax=Oryza meridionalis TaxID=40149 RepID=A0A0E0F8D9_9ORYZ
MESLSSVSTIVRIAQEIAGAVSTVSRNRSRCRKLANRVRCIGDLLRELESSAAAGDDDDEATRRLLDGLEDALHRALELVTSCQDSGCPRSLIAGGRMAGQFDEMDREIDRCLLDLGIANRIQIARLERLLHQNAAFLYGDGDPAPAAVTLRIGMPCDDDGVEHIKRRIHTVQAAAACSKDQRLALKDNKLNRNVELVNVKRPVPVSNGGGVRKYDGEEKYSKANNKGAGEVSKEKAAAMAVAMANMVVTNASLPFAVALLPIGDVAGGMYHPASPYSFSPYPQGPPGNAARHRVPTPANKYGGRGDAMVDADGYMGAGKSVKSFTADSGGGDKKAAESGRPVTRRLPPAMSRRVPAHEVVPPPSHGYGYWPYAGHGPPDAATAAAAVATYYRTFEHMFSDENPNACTIM